MFLDYFALGLLFFVALVIFYGVIAIHDIPYEIAKKRNHPQQDALHIAGWVSLFTMHAIWPFLWIWATLYREDRGWGFSNGKKRELILEGEVRELMEKVEQLNQRLGNLESPETKQSQTETTTPQQEA
ncbi:DUF3302 domain-containing protein [Shewanella sp. 1_MG-2023]|jgi:hypothetical protein|uniref:DUF3302 domain-containing protein n=1 Tax=Shewanella electrodiphila TaxID=934143 RepID=A0ABT0KJE2_9GAMM|nr:MULTISPECIES: DUF3302 domain-containing protein [Shewanella]MCL1043894.1 DUF3302 domain-containing protein [Shewanella electrodiphila]MDO6609900.1 DUF3302 domain-containing protein [Shewanella sp. 7_MG-2023]MDO6769958.1 DUF3302 domain-containing protein [Shewanella sp. 2_MG-2023]MDO6793022.1 DUF3302 domain-containing protein [Shewanella sp. 1_MG-2023]PMG70549.1 GTPase [Shewanella sp. 10N.286.51.B7]